MDCLFLRRLEMEVPRDVLLKILSYHDLLHREAFAKRAPSARLADELIIVSPVTEYMMARGRPVALTWDRPYFVTRTWGDRPPTRASILPTREFGERCVVARV